MKKLIIFPLLTVAVFALTGCNGGGNGPTPSEPLKLSTSDMEFTGEAGEKDLTITCDADWEIAKTPAWCSVDVMSGKGTKTVKVSVIPNTPEKDRTTIITVKSGVTTKYVNVRQLKSVAQEDVLEITSGTTMDVAESGKEIEMKINATVDYDVIIDSKDTWVTNITAKADQSTVTLKVAALSGVTARAATVTIKGKSGDLSAKLLIKQSKANYTHIHMEEGAIGAELSKISNIGTVANIVITGKMNSEDFRSLKNTAVAITTLDLAGLDIEMLPHEAFISHATLQKIVLPLGLKEIGRGAFNACKSLNDITFPAKVETIGREGFKDCISLETIVLPTELTVLAENAFARCIKLKNITFNAKLKTIKLNALTGLTEIETINMENTAVETIGASVFYNCTKLKTVTLPKSLKSVDEYTFANTEKLETIICHATAPPVLGNDMFNNGSADKTLRVPTPSIDAYKGTVWNTYFKGKIESI